MLTHTGAMAVIKTMIWVKIILSLTNMCTMAQEIENEESRHQLYESEVADGSLRRKLWWKTEEQEQAVPLYTTITTPSPPGLHDPLGCVSTPRLHTRQKDQPSDLLKSYFDNRANELTRFEEHLDHIEDPEHILTQPPLTEATFTLWDASTDMRMQAMSLYNDTLGLTGHHYHEYGHLQWKIVPPPKNATKWGGEGIKYVTTFRDGLDRVAFVSHKVEDYVHVMVDHLGYIAYLRETLPPTTRILLVDTTSANQPSMVRQVLDALDPAFVQERVDWISCPESERGSGAGECHHQIENLGGGTLQVLAPQSPTRHATLLTMARDWYLERFPPQLPEDSSGKYVRKYEGVKHLRSRKYIVYYSRGMNPDPDPVTGVSNGRPMHPHVEQEIIGLIQHMMARYGRTEELVVFTNWDEHTQASVTVKEQMDLFRQASMVIGPYGGGLSNAIWMMPGLDCPHRPKILEFIPNPSAPDVLGGNYDESFHYLYASARWLEYHHLFLMSPEQAMESSPSLRRSIKYSPADFHSEDYTYVDVHEIHDALLEMMGDVIRGVLFDYPFGK
jgi:hypothetical protein